MQAVAEGGPQGRALADLVAGVSEKLPGPMLPPVPDAWLARGIVVRSWGWGPAAWGLGARHGAGRPGASRDSQGQLF